eukprot:1160992-Pelagomonas_calceolata.AAC.11
MIACFLVTPYGFEAACVQADGVCSHIGIKNTPPQRVKCTLLGEGALGERGPAFWWTSWCQSRLGPSAWGA